MNEFKTVIEDSKVTVSVNGERRLFCIVNSRNVDITKGHISFESLMGKALKGAKVGDKVSYKTLTGKEVMINILNIE